MCSPVDFHYNLDRNLASLMLHLANVLTLVTLLSGYYVIYDFVHSLGNRNWLLAKAKQKIPL